MNNNHPINDMIGRVIDIVGIAIGDRGRSCEEHIAYCGVVPDVNLLRRNSIRRDFQIKN